MEFIEDSYVCESEKKRAKEKKFNIKFFDKLNNYSNLNCLCDQKEAKFV